MRSAAAEIDGSMAVSVVANKLVRTSRGLLSEFCRPQCTSAAHAALLFPPPQRAEARSFVLVECLASAGSAGPVGETSARDRLDAAACSADIKLTS